MRVREVGEISMEGMCGLKWYSPCVGLFMKSGELIIGAKLKLVGGSQPFRV